MITSFNCWVKRHYENDYKDPKQPKPTKKDEKIGSKNDSMIKTNLTAVTAATVSTTAY